MAVAFTPSTRIAFFELLRDKPNKRRVSQFDKEVLINLLTNSSYRPASQQEFSRRNYVRKTFRWNHEIQELFAAAKTDKETDRLVVTENMIVDIVESVHDNNSHGGWDATWKDVSASYYGILRSDVIFLLKQCQICASDLSKRPKPRESHVPASHAQSAENEVHDFAIVEDVQHDITSWETERTVDGLDDVERP
ncbi:MAG: hypothetical protein Q9209_001549 [Squamulea sp. 1 TL-2023]